MYGTIKQPPQTQGKKSLKTQEKTQTQPTQFKTHKIFKLKNRVKFNSRKNAFFGIPKENPGVHQLKISAWIGGNTEMCM